MGTLEEELGTLRLKPELRTLKKELVSLDSLPEDLKKLVSNLGKRTKQEKVRHVILALTHWKLLTKEQFGHLLQRETGQFRRRHLNPMRDEGLIEYTIPDMINHPKQAYKITEKGRKALSDYK